MYLILSLLLMMIALVSGTDYYAYYGDGQRTTKPSIQERVTRSRLHCGTVCDTVTGCIGYNYLSTETNGVNCELKSTVSRASDMAVLSGWSYHELKDDTIYDLAQPVRGTTLSVSSEYDYRMVKENAVDGDEAPGWNTAWVTNVVSIPGWIKFHFERTYTVHSVDFMARCFDEGQGTGHYLRFSDGSFQEKYRTCQAGFNDWLSCPGLLWDSYTLVPTKTAYMKMETIAMCTPTNYDGLREVKVWGTVW